MTFTQVIIFLIFVYFIYWLFSSDDDSDPPVKNENDIDEILKAEYHIHSRSVD